MHPAETSSMGADRNAREGCLLAPERAPASVIAGLADLNTWSLWVPLTLPIASPSVRWLAHPVATLAVWHVGSGGNRSPRIRAKSRAFGAGSSIVDRIESMVTVQYGDKEIYSDVAVAVHDETAIAEFMSRSMAPMDSASALFPPGARPGAIGQWTIATLPLLSLWMSQSSGDIIGLGDLDSLLTAFFSQSLECGALPMLQLRDASNNASIVTLGERSLLVKLANGLSLIDEISPMLAKQISRGLRSPLAP